MRVKCLSLRFISVSYLTLSLNLFNETWLICLVYRDNVQEAWVSHVSSKSRSHMRAKYLSLRFVPAPYPSNFVEECSWNFVQMFSSLRRCVEGISNFYLLKYIYSCNIKLGDKIIEIHIQLLGYPHILHFSIGKNCLFSTKKSFIYL